MREEKEKKRHEKQRSGKLTKAQGNSTVGRAALFQGSQQMRELRRLHLQELFKDPALRKVCELFVGKPPLPPFQKKKREEQEPAA